MVMDETCRRTFAEVEAYLDGDLDQADPAEIMGRLAAQLRRLRPQVVVTFGPDGSYGHPDHIGGLVDGEGRPVFAKAEHLMGRVDLEFWLQNPSPAVQRALVPLKERIRPVEDGEEILPGVRAVASFGHTPGHMSLEAISEGKRLFIFGDAAGHYLLSLRFPQAYLAFDMDKAQVVRTRARLFQKVSEERSLITAYHFPWPAVGYIRREGEGYAFVPAFFEF